MAGIYIHIPFCRQKCYYCDFYKTVNTSQTEKFISLLQKEVILQKNYLENETIETIYFGGGTPSVLKELELGKIMNFLHSNYKINSDAEITFESNPDDLDINYLKTLYRSGINRLSIGIQSLQNEHLKQMNRRHNVKQAISSVENAKKTGFENISLDLIYGLPGLTNTQWQSTLNQVFKLPFQHLSAYHLTYHQGTPFYTWLKKGTLKEINESESIDQFNLLIEAASKNDFEQYEISNFAKNEMYSQHNTSYWTGKKYLGLGPSAHSFNGMSRQWNVSNLDSYLNAIENNLSFYEVEKLSEKEKINEYILTRLRTKWGVSIEYMRKEFGKEITEKFSNEIKKYKRLEMIVERKGIYTFSQKGQFISDEILTNLMII